jgi:predicted phage terminase large subunit-like protein
MKFTDRVSAGKWYAEILHQAEAAKEVTGVMAELGRSDLFFLLTRLLNRMDADNDWVFARCCEVQKQPDGFLDLWSREHYKSTIITYALTIQDILRDPEVTIGIFSHTRPIAKGFLRQIKNEFERNRLLQQCYPDVLWSNPKIEAPKWSEDDGIVVRRKGNPKEATLEAWGLVDGQPTGKHFSRLVYDDVVTRESVSSPEMIAKTTEAWALSVNLGTREGVKRYIGTRYHFNDTYRDILKRKAAVPRIYTATEDGNPEGTPVLLNRRQLEIKRREMGPYVFGCQMMQNPRADEVQGFKEDWIHRWDTGNMDNKFKWTDLNRYLLVDPASAKKSGSDYTVMLVIGLGQDHNYYLIDGIRDRLNLTERAKALFRLHRIYQPLAVGYERYGQQADVEHMEYVMGEENYRFTITPLGGNISKNDRIRKLIPLFEQGRFWLPWHCRFLDHQGRERDLAREFIEDEYLAFPVAPHDDMLDCMARITEHDLGAAFPLRNYDMQGEVQGIMDYDIFAGGL